jgi:hypothetical protein
MFNGPDYPKQLDEEVFNEWLESGRQSKVGYQYLMIVWDSYESAYRPVYAADRDEIDQYEPYLTAKVRESLVAAYNLYSESRIV